jgi:hypothetical protein
MVSTKRSSERERAASGARRIRWRLPGMAGLLVGGLGMVVAATPAHAALPVCNATTGDITACCKITGPAKNVSGMYNFTGTVNATAGGDCIQIAAPGVELNLNNNSLEGSNPTAPVGIGIHVLATAPGALVNGGADLNPSASTIGSIASFATGIQNDAAKATFGFFSSHRVVATPL